MDTKLTGKQLAFDIIEIATRHHIISEILAERLFEDHDASAILALDRDLIIEGAVEEFRKTFAASLSSVIENLDEEED